MSIDKLNEKVFGLGHTFLPKIKDVAKKINEVITRVNEIPPYYTYSAKLSQVGSGSPTATVIYSDLPTTVTYLRTTDGYYTADLGAQYGANKIFVYITIKDAFSVTQAIVGVTASNGGFVFTTSDITGSLIDLIDGAAITVIVYK